MVPVVMAAVVLMGPLPWGDLFGWAPLCVAMGEVTGVVAALLLLLGGLVVARGLCCCGRRVWRVVWGSRRGRRPLRAVRLVSSAVCSVSPVMLEGGGC